MEPYTSQAKKVRQSDGTVVTLKPGENPETYSAQPGADTQVQPTQVKRTYSSYKEDPRVFVDGQQQGVDVPVKSEEAVYRDMYSRARGELDALGQLEKDLLAEQNVINQKNERSTQAVSTLSGLAGSTEADIQQQKTTAVGQKANKQIQNEVNLQRQQLLSNLRKSATEEARNLRLEARQSEQDRIANRAARQQEAQTMLTNMSASGLDLDEIKASEPDSYNYLVKQYGSETALRGAYTLNTPQDQILDKRLEGGKYIIAKQNPVTGKINVETVDLGLPTGYSKTIDAGNRILAVPDNWDGDPAKLVSINKGLTPTQQAEIDEDKKDVVTLTPEQAKDPFIKKIAATKGGKPISDTFAQKIDKGLVVLGQIGTLQDNIKNMNTGPLVGAFRGKNPWDTNAQTIKAQLNAIVPNLARGVYGEVGVLTDNDIKNYSKTLPTLTSTDDIRNAILGITVDMVGKSIKNTLEVNAANQKDVSGFIDIYTELNNTRENILSQIPGYGGSSKKIMVGPDGAQYDASELSEEELRQAQADGYTLQ